MKNTLITIGKSLILFPIAIVAYVITALACGLMFYISNFVLRFMPFYGSDAIDVSRFINSDGFEGAGYIQGILALLMIRWPATVMFFVIGGWLFPSNRKFVLGIMGGVYILSIILCFFIIIGYGKNDYASQFDHWLRLIVETAIQVSALAYVHKQFSDKHENDIIL